MYALQVLVLRNVGAKMNRSGDVLVFGGAGRLGAPIVRLLIAAGYSVTVFARSTSDRSRLAELDISFLIGDLMESDSVVNAVCGRQFRVVIDASSRGSSRDLFYATAMRNILKAVANSHVEQFILLGSVGAGDNLKRFPDAGFERMRDMMQAKGEAELLLKAGGVRYTIIRSGIIRRDGTPATGSAHLTEDDTALGTVTRLDLAVLTLECVENQQCINKIFHAVDDSV